MSKPPEHKETNAQDGEAGWIMPICDGFDAIFSGDPTEKESPSHIAQECDQYSANDEDDPPLPGHSIKLAEENRNHERCRKGSNATACFIDAYEASIEFDDVSVVQRCDIEEV